VWVLAVRYDPEQPAVRMVLNGQSGQIHGRPPRSWIMIVGTVLGVLALIAAVIFAFGGAR
jgi:hypothetical protein